MNWRLIGKACVSDFFGRDFSLDELEDYALALNLLCAESFKDVIEYSRVVYPKKTGVLWWSLYDMWPMLFNYSVIDWEGNRKLPYYWIRQSQQDVALVAVRENTGEPPALYAVNGTLRNVAISYTVTAYNAEGKAREIACGNTVQAGNCAVDDGQLTFRENSRFAADSGEKSLAEMKTVRCVTCVIMYWRKNYEV